MSKRRDFLKTLGAMTVLDMLAENDRWHRGTRKSGAQAVGKPDYTVRIGVGLHVAFDMMQLFVGSE